MNDRNIGRFWISIDLVRNNPDDVADMFAALKIVPLRCEMMFHRDAFEYIALCPEFRETPPNVLPPEYELMIHRNKEGISYSVQKIQDVWSSDITR